MGCVSCKAKFTCSFFNSENVDDAGIHVGDQKVTVGRVYGEAARRFASSGCVWLK